ncbi:MAG: type II secretion system minor pseudopilin GspJ [Gammaproteobacteria bacterium]|jgi:general secretion pathway protein J|nr:type II secretion system minor pseudopilin GspJ [Gammaproteobacteria bacterium]
MRGFTLIELLIALMIFGILAMLAYGGLDSVMQSRERTTAELQRLRQLQITFSQMQRDIEQLTPRDGHDALAGKLLRLSAGQTSDTGLLMQYTKTGFRNPAQQIRSHLQRVAWRIEDNKLYRLSWPYVDRAFDDQSTSTLMMERVSDVKIRFLDNKNEWHNLWPLPDALTNGATLLQPLSVEVTLVMDDWGEIVRLFKVPG